MVALGNRVVAKGLPVADLGLPSPSLPRPSATEAWRLTRWGVPSCLGTRGMHLNRARRQALTSGSQSGLDCR